jgi:hypothetical protein
MAFILGEIKSLNGNSFCFVCLELVLMTLITFLLFCLKYVLGSFVDYQQKQEILK